MYDPIEHAKHGQLRPVVADPTADAAADRLLIPIDEYVKTLAQHINDLEFDHPEVDTGLMRKRLYEACEQQLRGIKYVPLF